MVRWDQGLKSAQVKTGIELQKQKPVEVEMDAAVSDETNLRF